MAIDSDPSASAQYDKSALFASPSLSQRVRIVGLVLAVLGLCALGLAQINPIATTGAFAAALTLLVLGCLDILRYFQRSYKSSSTIEALKAITDNDLVPAILVDRDGLVVWQNKVADLRFADMLGSGNTLAGLLKEDIASPQVVVRRIKSAASTDGVATETVVGLDGTVRLHAQMVADLELWRIETLQPERDAVGSGTPTMLIGRNGVVLSMNQAARDFVGTRAKSVKELFRETDLIDQTAATIMTKSGERQVQISTQPTGAGRTRVVMVPVTDRSAAVGTTLEDLPLPAMTISTDGRIINANSTLSKVLMRSDCVGERVENLLDGLNTSVEEGIRSVLLGGADPRPEVFRLKSASNETFVQMTLKRVVHGEVMFLVAILEDATELKSLEAQFVQGQKMQAIGQLAGGVAHDFNNLLTAISGHCDLMLLRHDQGDQDYADLIQIHQNANRAAALVSQLLAFSRKQTLQPENLDLRDILSDLAHLLNRLVGERVTLMLSHDPVLKPIRADKRQLEQVIMNLVVNARDAMPEGGQISIETESLVLTQPLIRDRVTIPAGDFVVVRVRDEGTGIPPDALGKVFEPFFTTKRAGEGTGLGLSTAYGIVKQTGGYIFVDSQPGQGTCFSLMFAAQAPQVHEEVQPNTASIAKRQEPCEGVVLLVEDEAPVRAFASRALTLRGFDVLEACCAEEALEMLSNKELSVDVFVTDVVMPGLDGPTWVKQALVDRPDTRVVFVSGYAEGAFEGNDPGVPGAIFLPKPFSLSDLTSTVQKQLVLSDQPRAS